MNPIIYYWYWWHREDFVPAKYHHLRHQTLERVVKLNVNAKRDGRSENPAEGSMDISKTESDVKLEANQHVEQQVRINKKIVRNLEGLGENEIPTSTIGKFIMEGLSNLDQVAYVRFASVYKNFKEAKDFEQFVGNLNVYEQK